MPRGPRGDAREGHLCYPLYMATREELAWAAGLFDGEGSINATSSIVVQLGMTDVESVHRFAGIVGVGRIGPWRMTQKSTKPLRVWQACGSNAAKVIEMLEPWLSSCKLADFVWSRAKAPNSGRGKGWRGRDRTTCIRLHPITPENIRLRRRKGWIERICLPCKRERARRS